MDNKQGRQANSGSLKHQNPTSSIGAGSAHQGDIGKTDKKQSDGRGTAGDRTS